MKNTFDLPRFARVLRYTWATQPVLPYIVMIAAIPLMLTYLLRVAGSDFSSIFGPELFLVFVAYLFGCSWLYAGLSFSEFGHFTKASRFLMLPGSVFEKWLAKVLLAWFVFPLIVVVVFQLTHYFLDILTARLFAFRFRTFDTFLADMRLVWFFLLLTLPAAFAAGIVWKRFGLLKGIVFVFVLLLLLYFLVADGFERYNYASSTGVLLREVGFPFGKQDCTGDTCALVQLFWVLAAYLPALLLFISTYVLMREKEV